MNPLKHVAIIMDGNGRWGLKNKNSRNAGHRAGLNTVEKIIKETIKNNIKFLTLYAFSTENWKRPKKEINFLFSLLENFLREKMYFSPKVLSKTKKGKKIIRSLFHLMKRKPKRFIKLNNLTKKEIERNICDFIAGMTDRFAINLYNKIK